MLFANETIEELERTVSVVDKIGRRINEFDFSEFLIDCIPHMIRAVITLAIVLLIWYAGKRVTGLVLKLFNKAAAFNNLDISVTKFLTILIQWIMYFLVVCLILNYLQIGTAWLVTMLGTAGLAIGMSLKDSLSNFAGSIILLIMKPFRVDDYIISEAGEGTVKVIGLIYTTLETIDKREIHIPNGALANANITNVSASPTRMIRLNVSISYSSDIKKAKELLEQMMREYEFTLQESDMEILVLVSELADSSIILEGRCHVLTENYWPAMWYFKENIKYLYDENGIEIPYNQLNIHMK